MRGEVSVPSNYLCNFPPYSDYSAFGGVTPVPTNRFEYVMDVGGTGNLETATSSMNAIHFIYANDTMNKFFKQADFP